MPTKNIILIKINLIIELRLIQTRLYTGIQSTYKTNLLISKQKTMLFTTVCFCIADS